MLVLPVYNRIVAPYSNVYYNTEDFKNIVGPNIALDEKVVILVLKEDQKKEEWNDDSFYPIGVSGVIDEISPYGFVSIKTLNRVHLDSVKVLAGQSVDLMLSRRNDIQDLDRTEAYQKLVDVRKQVVELGERYQVDEVFIDAIERMESIGTIAGVYSMWMNLSSEERYSILEEDSVAKRTELIEKMLYEWIEVAKVTGDASAEEQRKNQQLYKESALKKQMEYIQKELDDMHPENVSDVQRFAKAIADSGMNETARKEAEKALNSLRNAGQQSSETGMLYNYLDFMTSLSWKKEKQKHIDLEDARRILDEDHYGLKKVKERIIQQIAVMNLKKEQQGSILLLVGAPGTGKTSIGKSVARALKRKYVRVALGGVRDEADIRGHRRTYIGAMPGRIMDGIAKSGVSNPVMVLDEIDKLSMSYNGDPASALLEVLDPEQNNTFTDHYMNVPYDLSNVMFIATANSVDTIPEPLLNRMEVISFNGYTPDEKLSIAKEHLLPKSMEAMGIPKDKLIVPDQTLETIISDYTREGGVRGLRKRIDTLCREAAVKLNMDQDSSYTVSEDMLRDELDMRPMSHDKILETPKPGVVTGMAWTQVGGEILYIETLFTKGSGHLIITGQLGDVMKESAQIAVSVVKSMFPEKADMFKENDLHIHVPAGAVPKDGPSAGITLTSAIASLVSGKAVSPDIAMTGEMSLRGAVSAIGGLPEKLMAAQRAGVKKVFIPKENEDDLKDVAKEVVEALDIRCVSEASEVLKEIGIVE